MAEATFGGVKGRPRSIGRGRHVLGAVGARAHGWVDGLRGHTDGMSHERAKLKERGEGAGRQAAAWFAEVSAVLRGEIAAVRKRLEASEIDEGRLKEEIAVLAAAHGRERTTYSEDRFRERERDLGRVRRERPLLWDRLKHAEAQLEAAYELARTSAEEHKDYYEGLMRAYCAANKNAGPKDVLDDILLPESLRDRRYYAVARGQDTPHPEPPPSLQDDLAARRSAQAESGQAEDDADISGTESSSRPV